MATIDTRAVGSQRWFLRLAVSTALLTVGLIVFGAVVRVTDSGLGCGNDWPLCNGTIFPPLDNLTAWIEWLHRLFALLIGMFGLGMLVTGWRAYRNRNQAVMSFVLLSAFLFVAQSALGALVVVLELPPTFVTLHLGVAMVFLATLILSALAAWWKAPHVRPSDQVTTLTYANAVFVLVIILTGALVRGSGATLACTDWPLCNGEVLPTAQGQLALIHMLHRFAVLALGLSLALLVWQVLKSRQDGLSRGLAIGAFVLYLMQAGVGALYVLSVADALWGAAHVGMAAATWALLVVLSGVEAIQAGHLAIESDAWKPQSQTAS
jgi:heme A synthase